MSVRIFSARTLTGVRIITENIFVVSREEDAHKMVFPGWVVQAAALGANCCCTDFRSHPWRKAGGKGVLPLFPLSFS